MKIVLYGASGMVGQGVLNESLRDADVKEIVLVGRSATGLQDPKLREIVWPDLSSYRDFPVSLADADACFYSLGVSAMGLSEEKYTRITYDLALAAASFLGSQRPGLPFMYVSGAHTDSSEKGRVMWARVKGKTENALMRLAVTAYAFRPGMIEPLDNIRSKTALYNGLYGLLNPLMPIVRKVWGSQLLTTRDIGKAALSVARQGFPKRILEIADLRQAASGRRSESLD